MLPSIAILGFLTQGCGGETNQVTPDAGPADAGMDAPPPPPTFSDWPSYGHDRENTRTNPDEQWISPDTVSTLVQKWSKEGIAGVTATPTMRDATLYFSDWRANIYAVDPKTGTDQFVTRVSMTGQVNDSALLTEDRIYVGDGDAMLHAVDRATGMVAWTPPVVLDTHQDTIIYSSPNIVDNIIVIGVATIELVATKTDYTSRGSVIGIDATSGAELWRTYTADVDGMGGAGVSVWSSAAIDSTRKQLYVGTGQNYEMPASPLSDAVIALDYETGALAWVRQFTADDIFTFGNSSGPDFDVGASPHLFSAGGKDFVGVGDKGGHYFALDRDTGNIVWSVQLTPGTSLGGVMASPAVSGDTVYVASNAWANSSVSGFENAANKNTVFALAAADGAERWRTTLDFPCLGGLAVANGVVYLTTTGGFIHGLNAETGEPLWSAKLPLTSAGGVMVSGGMVFAGFGWSFFQPGQGTTGGLVAFGLP
jgi:polyvinyl alcohol dehydrogenase (cytochrome)